MANTKSVLVIGGSGFVGSHVAAYLAKKYKVFTLYHSKYFPIPSVTPIAGDVFQRDKLKQIVYLTKPDFVIYCAGKEDLYWAEKMNKDAERIIATGIANLALVSDILQPKILYLSSCYVFDGKKGNFKEGDPTLPSTSLGKIKLQGENHVRSKSFNHAVLRCSPVFGMGNYRHLSWFDQIRLRLGQGKTIELSNSVYYSYLSIQTFAEVVQKILESGAKNKNFHVGGTTKLTPFQFAKEICRKFDFDPTLVCPVEGQMADYSINCTASAQLLQFKPLDIEQEMQKLQEEYL